MKRDEAVDELRSIMADTKGPKHAWSDDRLVRWLSIAQDQFCKDTGFFLDNSTYNITTEAGTASYVIDPRVLQVNEAYCGGSRLQMFSGGRATTASGRPIAWQSDQQTGRIALWPTPDDVYTVDLAVWRRSLVLLNHKSNVGYDTEFELPEDSHHLACVEYAAYKALSDHDRELQDPVKAAEHLSNYKVMAREGKRDFQRLCGGVGSVIPNTLYVV